MYAYNNNSNNNNYDYNNIISSKNDILLGKKLQMYFYFLDSFYSFTYLNKKLSYYVTKLYVVPHFFFSKIQLLFIYCITKWF